MGANQSNQQAQHEKKRPRKRDLLMGLCMSQLQPKDAQARSRLQKSLSENMKCQTQDILTKMSDEEMPKHSIKILQYFLNFLSIKECIQLKLVNRKLKFMIEMSSNIYSNFLSQYYLRKLQLHCFVEYGLHRGFASVFSEQLLNIETNQDESWIRIYANFHKSISQLRRIEEEISSHFSIDYSITEKILEICRNPTFPIPILTDDVLKQSTTSWFQLELAQKTTDYSAVERVPLLDQLTDKLYAECEATFNKDNIIHTQLLFELRWIIIDNFIKDPSSLEQHNVPILLKLLAQLLHFIYQRCIFSRNVLTIIKQNKKPALFLNMYSVLWESFIGIVWALNRSLKKMYNKLDQLFNKYYTTQFPQITFTSALVRLWTQIVIKGTKNVENDPIENELFLSFDTILRNKRNLLFEYFTKDQIQNQKQSISHIVDDDYFKYCSSAVDSLLNKFTSNILDLSLHEQSIHWIGHSQVKVGQLYGSILEIVVKQTNELYNQASIQFSTNFTVFKDYIQAETRYMQEILNQWTVQVCILPIGINYLYDKIKINLRQYVLSCQLNSCIVEQSNFEENILESQIIPPNLQFIKFNEPDELSSRIEREDSILESFICQILKEEMPQTVGVSQLVQQHQQQSIYQQQFNMPKISSTKQQSIIEGDYSKLRMLSTFSASTRVSQVTQLTSVLSQQILSSIRSNLNMFQVKDIRYKLENNQWATYLKDIHVLEVENKIKIDKRNNQIQMRNFMRQIPQDLEESFNNIIDFTKIWNLLDTQNIYLSTDDLANIEINKQFPQRVFSEIQFGDGLFASYFQQV
ncbi:unnamed protein product (macronuclear) [Paramecium tetraurelia]|uniref:F-box domain-containing protein n=1 Tax=Paramecium tetraurelia TaxID=5888 RepID=A0DKT1_PARTE|nr:uncharacterized protein GSPATT00017978001 [Paramecium tetraurelia]CAK83648.1 unnamed protein product [Paramecium tetraurelia]|eukprot:XP_001451045.1 hypothetical protein (macronuclear) [Paramecium tetraurelia strain d4-2]